MTTAIVTSKGQITIPQAVRAKLGLDAGDRVEFIDLGNGQFGFFPATEDIRTLKGRVPHAGRPVSLEAMNAAIRRHGSGR